MALRLFPAIVFFFFPLHAAIPEESMCYVHGQVQDESNRPVPNAFVYVVEGEEEALTDAKGNFRIQTWQPLPFTLTVQQPGHASVKVKVVEVSRPKHIRIGARKQ